MALGISQSLLGQLRQHGEETYPHECCGILVGTFAEDGIQVQSVMRCGNTAGNRGAFIQLGEDDD